MIIAEYFKDSELACPCCGLLPDHRFTERLYAMRLILGFPLPVNSGCRCLVWNRYVGGEEDSTHLFGAADLNRYKIEKEGEIIYVAMKVGMTGIGFQDNKFLHVDDKHKVLTTWGY